jgi:hypothetical protein
MKILIQTVIFLWALHASASTVTTPAGLLTEAVRNAIYASLAEGEKVENLIPARLNQKLNIETLKKVAQGDIWSRFQLVSATKVQDPDSKNRILAVTAFQVSEDRHSEIGRYVVWINAKSSPPPWESLVWVTWEPETKVAQIFQAAKVALEDKGVWQQPNTIRVVRMAETKPNSSASSPINTLRHSEPEPNQSAPFEGRESNAAMTPSEEPSSSTPWSVIVILIVAATGLLRLLLKNRK